MIALIKEEKKIAPSPYPNCNKAVVPLEVMISGSVDDRVVGWYQY